MPNKAKKLAAKIKYGGSNVSHSLEEDAISLAYRNPKIHSACPLQITIHFFGPCRKDFEEDSIPQVTTVELDRGGLLKRQHEFRPARSTVGIIAMIVDLAQKTTPLASAAQGWHWMPVIRLTGIRLRVLWLSLVT